MDATASMMPLVCVVDDEQAVRQGLGRLLKSAGFHARTFSSAREYLDSDSHPGPCCLILDVNMPDIDGMHLQEELGGSGESIVFLTGCADVPMCARAIKAGAVDFLTKPVDDEVLLAAVKRALDASRSNIDAITRREEARRKISKLTPRESAVMERVVAGMLNKQIAADFGIAEKTIKVHRGRMMRKIGVVSVPDLVRLSITAGRPPAAAIAHELNQPLAAILGNAQAARRFIKNGEINSAELSAILDDIISDTQRAAEMIRKLQKHHSSS
jgi:FixJ family two-component response regulator